MRISLLLKREPFGLIIEKTLQSFLRYRFGQVFRVKWHAHPMQSRAFSQSQVWVCNPYINAIFVPTVNKKVLSPLVNEYQRSLVQWRRPFQRWYVSLSVSSATSRIFALQRLEISPRLRHADHMVIMGGNRRIRLHDYHSGKAFVICKAGLDNEPLMNEIKIREANPDFPCPKLFEWDSDKSWFAEEPISGIPINRLEEQQKRIAVIDNIWRSLLKHYTSTRVSLNAKKYICQLVQRIMSRIETNGKIAPLKYEIVLITKELVKYIEGHISETEEILTVQSHGDFQPANILAGDGKNWLIDWEYTARRTAGYDGLVFSLSARFPEGFAGRVLFALEGKNGCVEKMLSQTHVDRSLTNNQRFIRIAFFLLEDMLLKLKETENPWFAHVGDDFVNYVGEFEKIVKWM